MLLHGSNALVGTMMSRPIQLKCLNGHLIFPDYLQDSATIKKQRKGYASDGSKKNFSHPSGMSGSPLIALYDENGDNDFFPVVGVFTSYRKRQRIAFGTDVQYVIDAIKHAAK